MWLLVDTLWDCPQVSDMQLARMQLTHVTMVTHWSGEPTQGSVWQMVPGQDLLPTVTLSVSMECNFPRSGLEVIKLEFILRLKIKRNDWLLADMCQQAANHCASFESESVIMFTKCFVFLKSISFSPAY